MNTYYRKIYKALLLSAAVALSSSFLVGCGKTEEQKTQEVNEETDEDKAESTEEAVGSDEENAEAEDSKEAGKLEEVGGAAEDESIQNSSEGSEKKKSRDTGVEGEDVPVDDWETNEPLDNIPDFHDDNRSYEGEDVEL